MQIILQSLHGDVNNNEVIYFAFQLDGWRTDMFIDLGSPRPSRSNEALSTN